jgi:phosphorylase kinase alpha/beta subunit
LRDNVYASLGFEAAGRMQDVVRTYRALLNILKKHKDKIDWMIRQPLPKAAFRYIHARYDPMTGNEIWEEWGNKQNDAVGAILFKIGQLERKGIKVLRDDADLDILQRIVRYLEAIEYWHDADNGMWEEAEEVHVSSVGACVAGLIAVSPLIDVPKWLVDKGVDTLNYFLPRESVSKETDLALLSLIYPYNVVTPEQRDAILHDVETKLLRAKGVIRYEGDMYYNRNGESAWTMGLPWLAIIYKQLNMPHKHAFYMRKTVEAMNKHGELPELYFADSDQHNMNTPLAWGQSLYVVASQE